MWGPHRRLIGCNICRASVVDRQGFPRHVATCFGGGDSSFYLGVESGVFATGHALLVGLDQRLGAVFACALISHFFV